MSETPKPSTPIGDMPKAAVAASEGNPALRMMGLPRLRAKLPSRNWSIFFTIVGSFSAAVIYDKRETKRVQQKWCNAVSHLSEEILPQNRLPQKLTIFLSAPPGDGLRVAREHFQEYVKPLLVAAAVDWDVVEGRREGGLRANTAARVRKIRRKNGEVVLDESPDDIAEEEQKDSAISGIRQKFGVEPVDTRGGDIVIGRHTWKEYIRGIHEGWLGPMDAPKQAEDSSISATLGLHSEFAPPPVETSIMVEPSMTDVVGSSSSGEGPETTPVLVGDNPSPTANMDAGNLEKEAKEDEKPKPKPNPTPPYILPASYPKASLSPSTPSTLPPSTLLPLPHLLGFFNFPIRIYRFLNRRVTADRIGLQVATILLSSNTRPYQHDSSELSAAEVSIDGYASSQEDDTETAMPSPWEQQRLLLSEETDWHKTARKPNPPEDEHKERPWMEPMTIDPRIGSRMRTPEESEDISAIGTGASAKQKGENGSKILGNSAEWKGGADRPERVSWGNWFKEAAGFETDDVKCKGWEQGNVGSEDE